MNLTHEDPGLDGPDYVALVIEWEDQEWEDQEWEDQDEVTAVMSSPEPDREGMGRKVATMLGALGALALATWGLRRLRAA
jgi:hypothetical protein